MDGFQIQVGGRTRALGCLIAALPFLAIFGIGFVLWLFARMIGDAILPSGSSGFSEALVGIVVIWLLLRSLQRGMFRAGPYERGWWSAVFILVALHATDLPLYDGRINVAGWILLAGMRAACWPQGFRPQLLR